ncbi:MAG: HEAT repeat domain-containing protein [Candidatus Cloacimonetes bacterium]|nr:HEAT repeat domain-containing protein [Candidatus Cloacimonadota bacterium]
MFSQVKRNIIQALRSPDTKIRRAAIDELFHSELSDKFLILEKFSKVEKNLILRERALELLSQADVMDKSHEQREKSLTDGQRRILKALNSNQEASVRKAFTYLLKTKNPLFLKIMIKKERTFKDDFYKQVNIRLITSLGARAYDLLLPYLKGSSQDVLQTVLQALRIIGSKKSISKLLECTQNLSPIAQKKSWDHIKNLNPKIVESLFKEYLNSSFSNNRKIVATGIGTVNLSDKVDWLEILIGDEDDGVREAAWKSLEDLAVNGVPAAKNLIEGIGSKKGNQSLVWEKQRQRYNESELEEFDKLYKEICSPNLSPEDLAVNLQKLSFCKIDEASKVRVLKLYLHHESARVRANAVEGLASLKVEDCYDDIFTLIEDANNRVVGNVILCLSESSKFNDKYFGKCYKALQRISEMDENSCLTVIFCIDHILDERLVDIAMKFMSHSNLLIRERASQMLETWALNSEHVARELEIYKVREGVDLEFGEELDEFID